MGTLLKGDTGHAYNNFKIAAGLKEGKHQGMHWHDGDFYKWMESAVYVYAVNKDPKILKELDEIIDVIGKAQQDDGYLSTQITLTDVGRWSNRKYHELYNSQIRCTVSSGIYGRAHNYWRKCIAAKGQKRGHVSYDDKTRVENRQNHICSLLCVVQQGPK